MGRFARQHDHFNPVIVAIAALGVRRELVQEYLGGLSGWACSECFL